MGSGFFFVVIALMVLSFVMRMARWNSGGMRPRRYRGYGMGRFPQFPGQQYPGQPFPGSVPGQPFPGPGEGAGQPGSGQSPADPAFPGLAGIPQDGPMNAPGPDPSSSYGGGFDGGVSGGGFGGVS